MYNTNDFDDYAVNIDSECLHQDFDDVDLYGEKIVEDNESNNSSNLVLE